jgi:hypothetical protein
MSRKLEVEVNNLKEAVGLLASELDRLIDRLAKLESNGNGRKATKSNR